MALGQPDASESMLPPGQQNTAKRAGLTACPFFSRLHWNCDSQMSVLTFSAIVFAVSALAGLLGSLTGLGGGVVVTPVLTLLLGVDLHYAMGATLVSVIATSSGAAAAYVKEGYSNIRVGMFLEIATTVGAVAGGHLTSLVPASSVAALFGCVL